MPRDIRRDRLSKRKHDKRPHKMKASALLMQLREDVKAMNSAISILSQKMRHLTRNEKILGRNLIVLNKKIKGFSEGESSQEMSEELNKKFEDLREDMEEMNKKIEELNIVIANLNKKFVTSEDLKELRYIIDSINPLELATVDQVKKIVKKTMEEQQKPELDLK